MFIIYQYVDDNVFIGIDGHPLKFNTHKEAENYAKKNCAWNYKILEI